MSSAAPSATSCSAGPSSTWTSRAASPSRLHGRTQVASTAPRSRSPSGTAPGGSRLTAAGFERLAELGLLEHLGGTLERADLAGAVDSPDYRLVAFLGDAVGTLPISKERRRYAIALLRSRLPDDASPRAIHRFRRAVKPWELDALALHGRLDLADAVLEARSREPAEPLVRGDELGLPPGPEIGRLLDLIEEERAAGTITTREEALELVRRRAR